MGPKQSKDDLECRKEMRRKIKEARKNKKLNEKSTFTHEHQYQVVEMDKIGNIASDADEDNALH